MEKIFHVEGMMCRNCETHVKNALESIDGVTEALASHKAGNVVVKMERPVLDEKLIAAIVGEGYKVK